MNMIKCLKKLLIRLHEWVQKKWLIVSVLMSTSSIWFSLILSFWGEKLHFIVTDASGKRQFTFLGAILTILVVGFSCLLAMAQRYYEYSKLNNDKDKRKLVVLENVDIETNKICDNKYITLKKRLWKIKNGQIVDIPQIVSNPCEQLKHILDKMNNCLCKLLYQKEYSINSDELYISLYYNFPMENNVWRQADSLSPEKGLTIDELMDEKSTFSKVLSSKKPFLFYNSKEQARKLDSYIRDGEDRINENDELKGSIACYRIVVKEEKQELIKAVLSITTYNKRFVSSDNKKIINNVKFNMDEYIFKPFIKRIDIELCLLYLATLYNGSPKFSGVSQSFLGAINGDDN